MEVLPLLAPRSPCGVAGQRGGGRLGTVLLPPLHECTLLRSHAPAWSWRRERLQLFGRTCCCSLPSPWGCPRGVWRAVLRPLLLWLERLRKTLPPYSPWMPRARRGFCGVCSLLSFSFTPQPRFDAPSAAQFSGPALSLLSHLRQLSPSAARQNWQRSVRISPPDFSLPRLNSHGRG